MQTHKTTEMLSAFLQERSPLQVSDADIPVKQSITLTLCWIYLYNFKWKGKTPWQLPNVCALLCQFINDTEHKYSLNGRGMEVHYIFILTNQSI